MNQLPFLGMETSLWRVNELNRHIRQLLESDYRLQDLWVAGEVSNMSQPASGHLYFTLVDSEARLRCVMWRSEVNRQLQIPREGDAVEVHGRISVYEAGGQYQLYADAIRPAGEGERLKEFLRLRDKLAQEGLFDPERKRPLPEWPRTVGVVTSETGAALQDVVRVLRRRYPLVRLLLSPTPVQGAGAPELVIKAMNRLWEHGEADVILLVRGGGSAEDLAAFNDEQLVRAVASSPLPVVTGIGHEIDVILVDYAADVRAATPTAAAEVVTPDREELLGEIHQLERRMTRLFGRWVESARIGLLGALGRLRLASPFARIREWKQRVDELGYRATALLRRQVDLTRSQLQGLEGTLKAVGPEAILARGYAIVSQEADQQIVRSVDQVKAGDLLRIRVSDGSFPAEAHTD